MLLFHEQHQIGVLDAALHVSPRRATDSALPLPIRGSEPFFT